MVSLVERRIRYDLVQTYKIINGIDNVDPNIWFRLVGQTAHTQTRNTAYERNLLSSTARTDVRKNFFSMRVVPLWNAIPQEVKESRTLASFKKKLEEIKLT